MPIKPPHVICIGLVWLWVCAAIAGDAETDRPSMRLPSASITSMSISGLTHRSFTMQFSVEIKNPNPVELPLPGTEYQMTVAGKQLFTGKLTSGENLCAGETRQLKVPVEITFSDLTAVAGGVLRSGMKLPYSFKANLVICTGNPLVGDLRIPIRHKGVLKVADLLRDLRHAAVHRLAEWMPW